MYVIYFRSEKMSRKRLQWLLFLTVLLGTAVCRIDAEGYRFLSIGNSLSIHGNEAFGMDVFARAVGYADHDFNSCWSPGKPLVGWVDNPAHAFIGDHFISLTDAYKKTWDVLLLQPFDQSFESDLNAGKTLITNVKKSNPGILIIVYQQWPMSGETYANVKESRSVAFYEKLAAGYQAANPGNRVVIAPCGLVHMALHEKIAKGEIPGLTSTSQLFDDDLHQSRIQGYANSLTWLAVTYGKDIRTDAIPNTFPGWWGYTIPKAQTDALKKVVWDVVISYTWAKMGTATNAMSPQRNYRPAMYSHSDYTTALLTDLKGRKNNDCESSRIRGSQILLTEQNHGFLQTGHLK
jgi:hypothetical protein